jgi:hypothetical protein
MVRTAIAAAVVAVPFVFAPAAFAGPTGYKYTIGGDVAIMITWRPADCIHLNWPTASEPICKTSHTYVGHQYHVLPGQVIGVDPDISGNEFAACNVLDISTGNIIWQDSGTLGDGHDITCLINTYGSSVESQGLQ